MKSPKLLVFAIDALTPELLFENLERFLAGLISFSEQPNRLLMLSSDHGNIEDTSSLTHTRNPVPLVVLGDRAAAFRGLKSLAEVTPAIVEQYTDN